MPLYHKEVLTSRLTTSNFLCFLKYNLTDKRVLQARTHSPDILQQKQQEAVDMSTISRISPLKTKTKILSNFS